MAQPKIVFTFVSIPPHTMLPNGKLTHQYHLLFTMTGMQNCEHKPIYTLPEAKRVLAHKLHVLRGGKPFIQYMCCENGCELWKLAEKIMSTAADRPIALEFHPIGAEIGFKDHPDVPLAVRDAMVNICNWLQPPGLVQGRQN